MNGYFKPLRRKLGVVTLGFTCIIAAGWVRSFTNKDEFGFADLRPFVTHSENDGELSGLISHNQSLALQKYRWEPDKDPASRWETLEYESVLVIPYWSLVLPLTAFCAWLLLSKRSQPTKIEESQERAA